VNDYAHIQPADKINTETVKLS